MSLRVLGVMTGTSCDGLDASCIEIDESGWSGLWSASAPYPAELRKRVLGAQKPGFRFSTREFLELNRDLGEWYAGTVAKLIERQGERPDVIANHGQTVAHFPPGEKTARSRSKSAARGTGATLQMGDPTHIARATGLTVISSFRDGDMAAGGQGAPLVPLFHRLLAHALGAGELGVAFHNVGGISNLTYVGPEESIIAFDTGPGNVWIDAAAEAASRGKSKYDAGGKLAMRGRPDLKAVSEVLKHPYFWRPAPKSTGRDEFPFAMLTSKTRTKGADLVATATLVTVESIALAYESGILERGLPLSAIFLCGGGARNRAIIEGLEARLPGVKVAPIDETGFDARWIESQAFAYFGMLALMGEPLGGSWTGARAFGPPAHVIPGENWPHVLKHIAAMRS